VSVMTECSISVLFNSVDMMTCGYCAVETWLGQVENKF
jgi:hypothetical protein